jgi:hypothetical protein
VLAAVTETVSRDLALQRRAVAVPGGRPGPLDLSKAPLPEAWQLVRDVLVGSPYEKSDAEADVLLLQLSTILHQSDQDDSVRVRAFTDLFARPGHVFIANASVTKVFCDAFLIAGACRFSSGLPHGAIYNDFNETITVQEPELAAELFQIGQRRKDHAPQKRHPTGGWKGNWITADSVEPGGAKRVLTFHSRIISTFANWGSEAWNNWDGGKV